MISNDLKLKILGQRYPAVLLEEPNCKFLTADTRGRSKKFWDLCHNQNDKNWNFTLNVCKNDLRYMVVRQVIKELFWMSLQDQTGQCMIFMLDQPGKFNVLMLPVDNVFVSHLHNFIHLKICRALRKTKSKLSKGFQMVPLFKTPGTKVEYNT